MPYASSVSESGGNVTFYLNETADNVKVVFAGPSSTLNLGTNRGSYTFARGGAASYEIQVTKSAAPVWTQISQDTNTLVQFFAPRSVAVNQNPKSLYFGRIYVMEQGNSTGGGTTGSGRTISKGIYGLNPDLTDAVGQGNTGLTGGLDALNIFAPTANSRYEPWKLFVGEDGYVYVADAQDPRGSLSRVDANMANGELVLAGVANTARPDLHTVVYGINVRGSMASNNLTVVGIDGQWSGGANSVMQWNIGSGPLPSEIPPTVLFNSGAPTEQDSDIDVAPDGNIFVHYFRSTFSSTGPSVQVFSPGGTLLFSSISAGVDRFINTRSLRVSPDGNKLAVFRSDQQTVLVALTNGVTGRLPDMSNTNLLATFGTTVAHNSRSVTWDLAGNLYVANNNAERLRVWSPGGTTTATTKSDGTFNITVPPTTVTITNTVTQVTENSGTPVVFTLNRSGNIVNPLTVNLLVSGTASNGVDYLPAIPSTITFAGGATSTNITVTPFNDAISEFSETITVLIGGGTNYAAGTPSTRTVTILDDDAPEISIGLATGENRLLEGYSAAKTTFQLLRRGLLSATPTVNVVYSGQAAVGSKFNGPSSVTFLANAVTTNFTITPVNNQNFEGDQTAIAGVNSGVGYNVGATNTATAIVIDDEVSPGTILFSDNFNVASSDTSANWKINSQDFFADTHADFGFDYTTLGVSPLPGGSDTLGLRLRCNQVTVGAPIIDISLSPLGLNLGTNDYRLVFNMWINYNGPVTGPLADGGPGSTYHLDAGVGTTGDHPNWQNFFGTDGVWFSIDGDGGSGATSQAGDANAYIAENLQANGSGVYAAGTADGVRSTPYPFYSIWGSIPAPAAQVALYPTVQDGLTQVGNIGESWHTVVITKATNIVKWAIDGVTIATVTNDPLSLSTNVFIGYHDQYAGISGTPDMSFAIVDNLKVMSYTDLPPAVITTPNITKIQVVGSNVVIDFTGGAADAPSAFKLQSSATVDGTYTDTAPAANITGSSGTYQATIAVNGSTRFYRIKR
ncbi:MAG: Calx-beta domain-containing protein [Verrucomicrobiota bacterium]